MERVFQVNITLCLEIGQLQEHMLSSYCELCLGHVAFRPLLKIFFPVFIILLALCFVFLLSSFIFFHDSGIVNNNVIDRSAHERSRSFTLMI